MILIGESLNIMSQTIGPALRERNPEPIQALAKAEEQGAETGLVTLSGQTISPCDACRSCVSTKTAEYRMTCRIFIQSS